MLEWGEEESRNLLWSECEMGWWQGDLLGGVVGSQAAETEEP